MQLHYRSYGHGPPLVILHGLLGSSDNWAGLARRLAAEFHVLTPDLHNHGQSPHRDEMDYPHLAQGVREWLDALGLPTVFLLGHSMGGKVAMQLAAETPARVSRLLVVDIAPRAYPPRHRAILDALMALRPERFAQRSDMEHALAVAIPDVTLRRFLLKNVARQPDGRWRWKINLAALHRNYDRLNHALALPAPYRGPTRFIRGGRSDYLLETHLPLLLRVFPAAHLVTIPEAGHWVHADAPDAFLRAVTEFLRA